MQDQAAQRLRQRRHEEGALDLETIEPRAVLEDGRVVDLHREEKDRARTLIEDFMIAANGVTARYLEAKGFASLRRVVRSPERWDRIEALAESLGERLPPDPDPKALAEFLIRRREQDPLRFPDLSLAIVKLLGRGEYVVNKAGQEPMGHFGLAVKDYVHSTAPNRRYPDLITQRLLKAALAGGPSPYPDAELDALALHCTRQEDAAEKVERQSRKSAAALLLSSRIGDRFDAIVTGASAKGTWVRIFQPPVEGKLVRGAEGLDVGDRLRVKLTRTDVTHGYIDFARSHR
jgi:exoribonuclease-2